MQPVKPDPRKGCLAANYTSTEQAPGLRPIVSLKANFCNNHFVTDDKRHQKTSVLASSTCKPSQGSISGTSQTKAVQHFKTCEACFQKRFQHVWNTSYYRILPHFVPRKLMLNALAGGPWQPLQPSAFVALVQSIATLAHAQQDASPPTVGPA